MTGPTYSTVPLLWPGETFVCLGGGPSLTADDVEYCRGQARVIAINDAYKLAPWADVLYACDGKWWQWAHKNYKGLHPHFRECAAHKTGLKFGLKPYKDVRLLRYTGDHGLERNPGAVRTGHTSGYQAINLAIHLGAARVLLLGYDMQPAIGKDGRPTRRTHFFPENQGRHPDLTMPPFKAALKAFGTMVQPLRDMGIEVINCTPGSALQCFTMRPLRQVLGDRQELAS